MSAIRRQRAYKILEALRDSLADRLSDLIVESEESLLQSADFDMGLHNEMYDLAERLRVVTVTLGVMPVPENTTGGPVECAVNAETTARLPFSFEEFSIYFDAHNYRGASEALARAFGISFIRAQQCVQHFHIRWMHDYDIGTKLRQLQQDLRSNYVSSSIALLRELFGMFPNEAQLVIHHITQPGRS